MFTYLTSPIGTLQIEGTKDYITGIAFVSQSVPIAGVSNWELGSEACRQLSEYFAGKRSEFLLPLQAQGTEFQQQVWQALQTVPYGETASYREIAEKIGNPKAVRAVGQANNRNPIAIVIPCHRIIGMNKQLTGYAGGLERKAFLLTLERNNLHR
jgi:methylated-DNA-[protein]-cysteine S-methyltransferase